MSIWDPRGILNAPIYTPHIVPGAPDVPWPVPKAAHSAALLRRRRNSPEDKAAKTQQLPLNVRILYRLRSIFAAGFCSDWINFGGVAAQLNHLPIVIRVATTESIGTDLR